MLSEIAPQGYFSIVISVEGIQRIAGIYMEPGSGLKSQFPVVADTATGFDVQRGAVAVEVLNHPGEYFEAVFIVCCPAHANEQVVFERRGGQLAAVVIQVFGQQADIAGGVRDADIGIFKATGGGKIAVALAAAVNAFQLPQPIALGRLQVKAGLVDNGPFPAL